MATTDEIVPPNHWESYNPDMSTREALNKAVYHADAAHILLDTLPDSLEPLFSISQAQVHATLSGAYAALADSGKLPGVTRPAPPPHGVNPGRRTYE